MNEPFHICENTNNIWVCENILFVATFIWLFYVSVLAIFSKNRRKDGRTDIIAVAVKDRYKNKKTHVDNTIYVNNVCKYVSHRLLL